MAALFGGKVVVEVAKLPATTTPAETDWKKFMAGTSKSFDLGLSTVSSDADDTGAYTENIVTKADLSISFSGEIREKDATTEAGFHNTLKYIADTLTAKGQPTLWIRMNYVGSTITAFMVITSFSTDGGGTNEISTCSAEFKVASGDTVKIVLDSDEGE